jgi:predicted RNA-binding protein YlqC (UPF0109 family)
MLKEILEKLVRAIVDKPEEIRILETKGQKICIYEVRVAKTDFGKVIGKHGQNALALRTILQSISAKRGIRARLDIIE